MKTLAALFVAAGLSALPVVFGGAAPAGGFEFASLAEARAVTGGECVRKIALLKCGTDAEPGSVCIEVKGRFIDASREGPANQKKFPCSIDGVDGVAPDCGHTHLKCLNNDPWDDGDV